MASRASTGRVTRTPARKAMAVSRPLNDTTNVDPTTPSNIAEPSPGSMTRDLRNLGAAIVGNTNKTPDQQSTTPGRLPTSAGLRSARRTPKISTPHAALGWERRRQKTPARNREKRRSGRFAGQGDDMFDTLQQLARQTADKSAPFMKTPAVSITPLPTASHRRSRLNDIHLLRDSLPESDEDDEPTLKPPRLSAGSMQILGYEENSDDEFDPKPPRQQSAPYDEADRSYVEVEPEQARRATSEQPYGFFRHSIGGRHSERFDDFQDDLMFSPDVTARFEDEESLAQEDPNIENLNLGENARNLRNAFVDEESSAGQDSPGFLNGAPVPGDEQTDYFIPNPPIENNTVEWESDRENANAEAEAEAVEQEAYDARTALRSSRHPVDLDALQTTITKASTRSRKKKDVRTSKHGIEYAPFPLRIVKKLATQFSKQRLSKEVLEAIHQASEQFLQQTGDDLGALAQHRRPKASSTIIEEDVVELMKHQRLINDKTTVFSLANRHLPREMLQEIRIQLPAKNLLKPKKKRARPAADNPADDAGDDPAAEGSSAARQKRSKVAADDAVE